MGKRMFGRVDERGGEFAATTFWSLWFLPLLPRQSVWVAPGADEPRVLGIGWHPRSIVVAYARTWCPVIAGICVWNDSVASFCTAAAAIALYAMSWIWRMLPGLQAQQRSDLHLLALGTRCNPGLMTKRTRAEVLAVVTRSWQAIAHHRFPEDVARLGSADAEELIRAYGVLVMHGVTGPPAQAKLARKAAARIIDGQYETAEPEGVFRSISAAQPILGCAQLFAIVADRAAIAGHMRVLAVEAAPKSMVQLILWGGAARSIGYLAIIVGVACGLGMLSGVRDPNALDFVQYQKLANTIGTRPINVRVRCDSIERHGAARPDGAWLCHVGTRILPIIALAEVPVTGVVYGTLLPRRPYRPTRAWEQRLERDDRVDMRTYQVFLDPTLRSKLGQILLGATVLVTALGLLVLWEVQRRRRNRLIAAARGVTARAS
jgi:hypothetical protein